MASASPHAGLCCWEAGTKACALGLKPNGACTAGVTGVAWATLARPLTSGPCHGSASMREPPPRLPAGPPAQAGDCLAGGGDLFHGLVGDRFGAGCVRAWRLCCGEAGTKACALGFRLWADATLDRSSSSRRRMLSPTASLVSLTGMPGTSLDSWARTRRASSSETGLRVLSLASATTRSETVLCNKAWGGM